MRFLQLRKGFALLFVELAEVFLTEVVDLFLVGVVSFDGAARVTRVLQRTRISRLLETYLTRLGTFGEDAITLVHSCLRSRLSAVETCQVIHCGFTAKTCQVNHSGLLCHSRAGSYIDNILVATICPSLLTIDL